MSFLRTVLLVAVIVGMAAARSEATSISFTFGTQACSQSTMASGTCTGASVFNWQAFGDSTTLKLAMDYNNTGPGFPFDGGAGTLVGGGVTVGDLVTVSGGTVGSTGTMEFSWLIDGQLSVNGAPYYSSAQLDYLGLPEAEWRACGASVSACGGFDSTTNEAVTVSIPFTFGTPLTIAFTLRGGTSGGSVDSYTARLQPLFVFDETGLQLAASVVSDDGSRYAVAPVSASPVPEPATLILVASGGAALIARRRRIA